MRNIPEALQARLDSGATSLATCWRLLRNDGVTLGFTDHDRDITLDGVTHRAGAGFMGSEAASRFDLSIDGGEISGALDDASLSEAQLAAGLFDGATVETWLVDWSDPELRLLTARGSLGEVRRDGQAFTAEIRGPADALAQESGRLFTAQCSADLGDARCGVNIAASVYSGAGDVSALEGASQLVVSGLGDFADGHFTAGRLQWTDGVNVGLAVEIKEHRHADGIVRLALWQMMPEPISAGDAFTITAGCDKRFETCRARFGNGANFRGFPHIPGNDFVLGYPAPRAG